MEQEKIEEEIQETELKEEKNKKIFILVLVLLIFSGTCYYYSEIGNLRQNKIFINNFKFFNNKITKTEPQKIALHEERSLKQLEEIQKEEETAAKQILKTKFKPTDKSAFLNITRKSSGKHDPFSYSESKFSPYAADENALSSNSAGNMGNLPALPTLSGLSGVNNLPSMGLAPPPAPKPEDLVTIKGFIGNKVIADINGIVGSLSKNEKVDNVKVLSVNSSILTAKFEINGKIFTKTMKSLIDENNENIRLVKNLHK